MAPVLVIDDDPFIASLIQALDPNWHVVPALDGLAGLDILRRYAEDGCPPDLIVLDINMPGFDGYDTCILIRAVAPTVPIVPFTQLRDDDRLPRYMQELQCTYPVHKGIDPGALFQCLTIAIHSTPATPPTTSAIFERLLLKAIEAERQARSQRLSRISIALFAPSLVQQLGLKHLLESISDPPVHITSIIDIAEDIALTAPVRPVLVAPISEVQRAFTLRQRLDCPMLLLADTFQVGASVARAIREWPTSAAVGVVLADHTVVRHASAALHALAAGKSYAEPLLRGENALRISGYAAKHELLPELSSRLIEMVVLDFLGWTAAHISDHFQVAPSTIETYWSRVAERLNRNRDTARLWVKQQLECQVVDQIRNYLESESN